MMKDGIDAMGLAREPGSVDSPADTLLQAKHSLARGDRVQMSALGFARHPNYGDIRGLVVREVPRAVGGSSLHAPGLRIEERPTVLSCGPSCRSDAV
jgi:hypothetical protein